MPQKPCPACYSLRAQGQRVHALTKGCAPGEQSLLAALGAVQFVSNGVFARYCLGEAVTTRTVKSTAGIVVGIVLVVVSASHRNQLYTVRPPPPLSTPTIHSAG
jgi:hypothetical protein